MTSDRLTERTLFITMGDDGYIINRIAIAYDGSSGITDTWDVANDILTDQWAEDIRSHFDEALAMYSILLDAEKNRDKEYVTSRQTSTTDSQDG